MKLNLQMQHEQVRKWKTKTISGKYHVLDDPIFTKSKTVIRVKYTFNNMKMMLVLGGDKFSESINYYRFNSWIMFAVFTESNC